MAILSERVQKLKTSSTLAVTAKARALKEAGEDVVSFGAGEPDFPTPANIVEAGRKALADGKTRYENTPGTPQARQAVADYFCERFGRKVGPQNVIISTGAKHALFLSFLALVNPGDEVLLPAPYWVSYTEQAKLAGGTVKVIETDIDNNFKVTPELLEKSITPQSKIFLLCSPSNPAGISYKPEEIKALAEVIERHPQLYVISDEIYERLSYADYPFQSFASANSKIEERVITINGLSKAYAMTGWRVGYAVADESIVKGMSKLQGQMTSNITACTYPALVEAYKGPQDSVAAMVKEFAKRADHIYERMMSIPGIKCPRPTGAFYIFPDVSAYFGKKDINGKVIDSAAALAQSLLEIEKVAVVPGEDFGAPKHIRLSFATSMELIDKGLDRIIKYMASLH
ncbi:pyridoxal phosphate-dependent aminotransferase [bacterium]|nr:pyridoxal phosphate-dependent aminotransferase [bacterium]